MRLSIIAKSNVGQEGLLRFEEVFGMLGQFHCEPDFDGACHRKAAPTAN